MREGMFEIVMLFVESVFDIDFLTGLIRQVLGGLITAGILSAGGRRTYKHGRLPGMGCFCSIEAVFSYLVVLRFD